MSPSSLSPAGDPPPADLPSDPPIESICPECGEDEEVLKATDASLTLRCTSCHNVRTVSVPRPRARTVALIVSSEGTSTKSTFHLGTDEEVAVGAEFEEGGHRLMVTAIELVDGRRAQKAKGIDVRTLHAKLFDQVALKVSVNEGPNTRSYVVYVEPDDPVHIGQVWDLEGQSAVVKTLKSDENRTIRRGGLAARHVRRVFCDPFRPGEDPVPKGR